MQKAKENQEKYKHEYFLADGIYPKINDNFMVGFTTDQVGSIKEKDYGDIELRIINSPDLIEIYEKHDEETALEMATGVRDKTGADIGISTTGISGPGGGTKTKPVGLVYIGVVTPENSMVKKYNFSYGRNIHREMATTAALNITRLAIE